MSSIRGSKEQSPASAGRHWWMYFVALLAGVVIGEGLKPYAAVKELSEFGWEGVGVAQSSGDESHRFHWRMTETGLVMLHDTQRNNIVGGVGRSDAGTFAVTNGAGQISTAHGFHSTASAAAKALTDPFFAEFTGPVAAQILFGSAVKPADFAPFVW